MWAVRLGRVHPSRPARSAFLIFDGKTYPAKFIRGLAYRLATGIVLDPSRDYAGGIETVRFFERLGLSTRTEMPPAPVDPIPEPPPHADAEGRPTVQPISVVVSDEINKVALVSHDYNLCNADGYYDYSEHFSRINRLCDENGCDTILYSLYTWDEESPLPRTQDALFGPLAHVQRIVFEVGLPPDSFDHVEVWQRGEASPLSATQRFATSSAPGYQKQAFLDDLPRRRVRDALLVICGETNIVSLVRASGEFDDPHRFADRLGEMNVRVVLNPVHDYMAAVRDAGEAAALLARRQGGHLGVEPG